MENPIRKIATIDLDRLKKEIDHIKLPETHPPQFPLQGKEADDFDSAKGYNFTLRTDEFEFGTTLYPNLEYVNSIIEDYQMFRTRLMWMKSYYTLAWHIDNSPRIHIPIHTNENCMWIIDRTVYRIPADGGVYLINTTIPHTFLNANPDPFMRLHLVGATKIEF